MFATSSFPIVPLAEIRTPFEDIKGPDKDDSPSSQHSSPPRSRSASPSPAGPSAAKSTVAFVDLAAQFPAVISRLCMLSNKLKPLSGECSFTIAVELRDQPTGEAPIKHSMPWIPSEPGLQRASNTGPSEEVQDKSDTAAQDRSRPPKARKGEYLGGTRTTPVRSIEAGPFTMEVWVEEGRGKLELIDSSKASGTSSETRS